MKYPIRRLQKYHLAYALLPYKRNQDVIKIHEFGGGDYCIAVADGWNGQDIFSGDEPGKEVSHLVATEFPKMYLTHGLGAITMLEDRIAKKYPWRATSVATFLFHLKNKETIVSVGDVETYIWDGKRWYKPKEISDHWLDITKYESNVARFFGSGKHKADPRFPGVFSAEPDVLEIKLGIPMIFATDGIKDVLPIADLNTLPVNPATRSAKEIVETVLAEIVRRGTQRDDISILVRTSKEVSKSHELREDRVDELDAAKLSRKDRGKGIPIKII